MKNYISSSNGALQSQLLSLICGIFFTLAGCITLLFFVSYYDKASLATFNSRIFIAALTGIAVFSSPDVLVSLQKERIGHLISTMSVRWLLVFLVVLLSAFLEKQTQALSRLVMILWLFTTGKRRKGVLIWANSACADLVESLRESPLAGIDMVGFFDDRVEELAPTGLPKLGSIKEAAAWLLDPVSNKMQADVVLIGLDAHESQEIADIVTVLQDSTISTYFVPESMLFGMPGMQLRELAGKPVLASTETPFIGVAALPKRLFDIVISILCITLLFPLFIAIAIGIKFTSPGPILFRQTRYGVGGAPIDVFKFRSMQQNNSDGPVIQATQNDQRITPLGRFLRKTSLDEIPQFFNVIQGNMSIVGPRPHAVEHNELYRKLVHGYMLRHKIKPGITGWAQVNGYRGETNTLDKMTNRINCDLFYIQHWSMWLDIIIILRTIRVVFKDPNAY